MAVQNWPWPGGDEILKVIREKEDTVVLACSTGKDSTAAWLKLLEYGFRVVPFHEYKIPGLSFVEDTIKYLEDYFQTHIIQLPSTDLWRMLRELAYQPPNRVDMMMAASFPKYDHDFVHQVVKEDMGLPMETYTALGIRVMDDLVRRTTLKRNGPINENRKVFYPVYDMNMDQLCAYLKRHKIKLGFDYKYFGSSFIGTQYRYSKHIKVHRPADWAIMLHWFPLLEANIIRHEILPENNYEED